MKPRTLITDRGSGMYGKYGVITDAYRNAVRKANFQTFTGDDASWQPGDLSDLFMHETVAAWADKYFKKHPLPSRTEAAVKQRLKDCQAYINKNHEVKDLTKSLPRRVSELKAEQGQRLKY